MICLFHVKQYRNNKHKIQKKTEAFLNDAFKKDL